MNRRKINKPKLNLNDLKKQQIIKNTFNNSDFDLYIDNSGIPKAGFGVFTNDFIPAECIIGLYEGEKIFDYDYTNDPYYYEIRALDREKGISSFGISAQKYPRCFMGMINDATDDPEFKNNCEFEVEIDEEDITKSKIYIVSIVDIEEGEELFVSYGSDYWVNK